jgi:hypothetical protein
LNATGLSSTDIFQVVQAINQDGQTIPFNRNMILFTEPNSSVSILNRQKLFGNLGIKSFPSIDLNASYYNLLNQQKIFEINFIEKEIQMLNAILDGRALEHHLEPSYFSALMKAYHGRNLTLI